jgi:DNA-binding IclR family transcriptional regulator
MAFHITNQAVATTLVEMLNSRGPLPVGYLAKVFGSPTSQIRSYLTQLQQLGTVSLYQERGEEMVKSITTTQARTPQA